MVKGSSFLTFFGAPNSFVSEKSAVKCTATELKKGKNPLPIQCVCHQQACWEIAIFLKTDYWHWWIILSLSRRTLDQEVLMEFTILWKLIAARIQVWKKENGDFQIFCCCVAVINPRCFLQFPVHIFQDGTLWPIQCDMHVPTLNICSPFPIALYYLCCVI